MDDQRTGRSKSELPLDFLKMILPISSGLSVVVGVLKMVFFYMPLDIYIIDYITINDAILQSLGYIPVTLISICVAYWLVIAFPNSHILLSLSIKKTFYKRFIIKLNRIWVTNKLVFIMVFVVIMTIIIILTSSQHENSLIKITKVSLLAFCTFTTLSLFLFFPKFKYYPLTFRVISILAALLMLAHYTAVRDLSKTVAFNKYEGTTLVLMDGTEMVCKENFVFVGKTSDYYFVYDVSQRSTLAYPKSEIKLINVKNKYTPLLGF